MTHQQYIKKIIKNKINGYKKNTDLSLITNKNEKKIINKLEKDLLTLSESYPYNTLDCNDEYFKLCLDTCLIYRFNDIMQDIDPGTFGCINAINEVKRSYNILLEKYYNKLLHILLEKDRKILVKSQLAWQRYKDADAELIYLINYDYERGTVFHINAITDISHIILKRVFFLYNYYDEIKFISENER